MTAHRCHVTDERFASRGKNGRERQRRQRRFAGFDLYAPFWMSTLYGSEPTMSITETRSAIRRCSSLKLTISLVGIPYAN
ncbi:MAG: hypothetical protein IPN33_26145 [Saprospiraceae bacterium]|nr:hypothetical protein [Saprospiraceae bacterium]